MARSSENRTWDGVIDGLGGGLVGALKWYLRVATLPYGRTRLMSLGARILGAGPHLTLSRDHRKFLLQFPRDRGWEILYFLGTFETGTTEVLRRILLSDDIVFDIGANIGWYTTLFALACPEGQCHAFEPIPSIFRELAANCELNGLGRNTALNELAVGSKSATMPVYSFGDLPHSYSSVSAEVGRDPRPTHCRTTTLDDYIRGGQIEKVDLIKVDVEGAELMVLEGAERVFSLNSPPMWVLEINFRTSKLFGYAPSDLLRFLSSRDDYHFFRIVEGWGDVVPLRNADDCAHADNVLCVPPAQMGRVAGRL